MKSFLFTQSHGRVDDVRMAFPIRRERAENMGPRASYAFSLSTFSNENKAERKESFGYVITARLLAAHLCYPEATVTTFGSRLRYFH